MIDVVKTVSKNGVRWFAGLLGFGLAALVNHYVYPDRYTYTNVEAAVMWAVLLLTVGISETLFDKIAEHLGDSE